MAFNFILPIPNETVKIEFASFINSLEIAITCRCSVHGLRDSKGFNNFNPSQ